MDSLELAALIDGEAVPIGTVDSLKFEYAPKIKEIEICDMISSGIFDVEEEMTVSFEVKMSLDEARGIFGEFNVDLGAFLRSRVSFRHKESIGEHRSD
jgi:hypothetical protein